MNAFISAIGSKLADRWASAIVAPGLLFLGAIVLADRLGQSGALRLDRLGRFVAGLADSPASHNTGAVLVTAGGILGASIAATLTAAALGRLIEQAWLLPGNRQPARTLRERRRRRWLTADAQVKAEEHAIEDAASARASAGRGQARTALPDPSALSAAILRRNAICLVEPARPTWIADRLRAVDVRVLRTYRLDLQAAWPHLWTVAAPQLREDLTAAQDAYASAARLAGWGLLYAVLTAWWWPAGPIAAGTLASAWLQARSTTAALADLVETTVDLHFSELAQRLDAARPNLATGEIGEAMTSRIRKDETARDG